MKPAWRLTAGVLAGSVIVLLAAYWETATSIYSQWKTSTYSHGLLVIPLCLYLVWKRRGELARVEPKPALWVLLLMPVLAFWWLLGDLTATAVVRHFALVAMIVVLSWGITGTRAARVLLMPLVFLFFAVPAGDTLIPLLQDFAAWFAVKLLELTRVPVLMEGRVLTIPSGKWEVAEACSGIHYLLATVTIGFVYADVMYRRWTRKAMFLAACVAAPVIANGIRVYGILLTDYLGGSKLARSTDHVIAGWFFLSVITILLFAIGMRWREKGTEERGAAIEGAPSTSGRLAMRLAAFAIVALLAASAAPAFARLTSARAEGNDPVVLRPPEVGLPWSPTNAELGGWRPKLAGADAEFEQSYARAERAVKLHVGYCRPDEKGSKVASSASVLFEWPEWQRTGEKYQEITVGGKAVKVWQVAIRSSEMQLVLWSWYWVDGEFTSNEYRAKWLLARARLTGNKEGSAIVVLATDEPALGESGESVLRDFAGHVSLAECLESAERVKKDRTR